MPNKRQPLTTGKRETPDWEGSPNIQHSTGESIMASSSKKGNKNLKKLFALICGSWCISETNRDRVVRLEKAER